MTLLVQCYTNMPTTTLFIILQLIWHNIIFILLVHQLSNDCSTKTIIYILFIHSYRVNNHFLSEIHVSCSSVQVKTLRMSLMPFLSWNKYWHLPFFRSPLEDIGFSHLRSPEFTKMQLEHFNTLRTLSVSVATVNDRWKQQLQELARVNLNSNEWVLNVW